MYSYVLKEMDKNMERYMIDELKNEMDALKGPLREKYSEDESALLELDAKVRERDAKIQELDAILLEKDNIIQELKQKLAQLDS